LLDCIETYIGPHEFIAEAYRLYKDKHPNNHSINGRIFEYLVCETLMREGITPFYFQARFRFVPNADFDVACYNPKRPVVLSMKVSLRERYKQADLEGMALRQVYRNAESYLITLSNEATLVSQKITEGDISGLAGCLIASNPEYTALLASLKKREFSVAIAVQPITGTVFPVSSI